MRFVVAENCGTYGRDDETDAEDEMVCAEPGVGVGVVGFDACSVTFGVWSAMGVKVACKNGSVCLFRAHNLT